LAKLLLLEDDRLFSETLQDFLEYSGYMVKAVYDPLSAYDMAFDEKFDLYLFDINLPFESGLDALKNLKEASDTTPTIFITSREDKDSLIEGFKLGCYDYIKKPFDFDELLVRVEAILNRVKPKVIDINGYILDLEKQSLFLDGNLIELNIKSIKLLELLSKNRGKLVRYEEIFEYLWSDEEPSGASLRVYITKLKKYFNIKSIRQIGYILE